MREPMGILNIFKEKGYTSHDVVAVVRRITGMKAGHTGTLDPQAEGVLPICLGKATRITDYITGGDKEYRAELVLGRTTDTEDMTGNMLGMRPVLFDQGRITQAILSFKGEYRQKPPMYSAVKINGRKLYQLAREGKTVERKDRLVFLYNIEALRFDEEKSTVLMQVSCSKGTYIRSLCADIGRILGCGGCMGELLRTRAGIFHLDDSIRLDELKAIAAEGALGRVIQPVETVLPFPKVKVKAEARKSLLNGNKISLRLIDNEFQVQDEKILVYSDCDSEKPVGIYEIDAGDRSFLKAVTLFL